MAFRIVSSGGDITDAAVVNMYASGVVRPGMVVDFDHSNHRVAPAGSTSTVTTIFGVCLDYAQGASDTFVRVLPFCQGQIWEADCVSAISTVQIGFKQQLYTGGVLLNNTSYDQTGVTGIFLVYNVDGLTTGSGKVLGAFLPATSGVIQNGSLTF